MLQVINIFEDGRLSGGPQRRIANIAQALYDKGINTTVLIPEDESQDYVELLNAKGVNFQLFNLTRPTMNRIQLIKYFYKFVFEIFGLTAYFKKNNIDLIHVSGGAWQIKGVIAGKLAGKKVIWHLNDSYMPRPVYKVFTFLKKFVTYFFLASGKVEEYYFPDKPPPSKYFIGAPVDSERFSPDFVESVALKNPGVLNVVTIAQMSAIKNIELLVEVAHRVDSGIVFHFIGPVFDSQKEYFENIKSQIERDSVNNIEFYTINSPHPERYLKATDVYFCTSRSEASPTSVWEAMSMALPVVSTDVSDLKIISTQNPQLSVDVFDRSDFSGFADKFNSLKIAKQNQQVICNVGNRRFVKKNFELSIIVDKHERAYKEIAGVVHENS